MMRSVPDPDRVRLAAALCCTVGLLSAGLPAGEPDRVLFRDEFRDLDDWRSYRFRDVSRHTRYTAETRDGRHLLVARSDASASGLIHRRRFRVREYPLLRWRWRVSNVYAAGNAETREGDDYPLRVYVLFQYKPEQADLLTSLKYETLKRIRGRYPPHSSLAYFWANRPQTTAILPNPYTARCMMIPLRQGPAETGEWHEEEVDILADYRRAFGEEPPATAALAVMNDADDTGERSTSFLDFVEVCRREP